ncbi:MAG: iron-sulfur cluster assembly accessory protein, partial [uncultured Gemmatimonadaceae bacterium]
EHSATARSGRRHHPRGRHRGQAVHGGGGRDGRAGWAPRERSAGWVQRLQVRASHRGRRGRGRPGSRAGGLPRVRRPVLGAVPERRHDRLRVVDAGLRLHVQESELDRRLRLRLLVLRV